MLTRRSAFDKVFAHVWQFKSDQPVASRSDQLGCDQTQAVLAGVGGAHAETLGDVGHPTRTGVNSHGVEERAVDLRQSREGGLVHQPADPAHGPLRAESGLRFVDDRFVGMDCPGLVPHQLHQERVPPGRGGRDGQRLVGDAAPGVLDRCAQGRLDVSGGDRSKGESLGTP